MWNLISSIAQQRNSVIVLSTHSMEEAEALSSKMGIMGKGGRFRCFGSSQHIRSKFATSYEIELKINPATPEWLSLIAPELSDDGVP